MLFFFLCLIQSRTHLHINEILIGNWSVNQVTIPSNSNINKENIFNLRFIKNSENDVEAIMNDVCFILHFKSKGFFEITDQSNNKFAEIEFFHPLFPHATSSGTWNQSSIFVAELISTSSMKLSLFDTKTKESNVLIFSKIIIEQPKSFLEKNFTMIATFSVIGIHFLKSEYQKRKNALELKKQNDIDMKTFLEEEDRAEVEEDNNNEEN